MAVANLTVVHPWRSGCKCEQWSLTVQVAESDSASWHPGCSNAVWSWANAYPPEASVSTLCKMGMIKGLPHRSR